MSDQPPTAPRLGIELPSEQEAGVFADFANIWNTPNTFVIDFLSVKQPPVDARLINEEANGTVLLTKVYRPRATEPKDFAQIITQALTRRDPGGKAGTTASVTFDAGSKSVVITGSPGDLQTATEILTQLETGTSQPQALQTRFIEVGTAEDAKRLLPLVEELYRNQMSGAGVLDIGAHAKLMSDDNGRLIVTASEAHLLRIEELVKQLAGKHGVVLNRQLSIIALKNTKLDTVFPGFEKLLTDRMADRRYEGQPKPSVVPDNANNRLLVTATPEQLKELEEAGRNRGWLSPVEGAAS